MKRIKNYVLYMVILFVPFVVFAANATANNWKLYCEEYNIVEGSTTKCYLLAQISPATGDGKNLTAVLTKMTGKKLFIDGVAGGSSGITATKTEYGANFTGSLEHSAATCGGELGCFDFTATSILPNTSSAVSQVTGNTDYTPIGVWTVSLDEEAIDAGSDECGQICMDVDYIIGADCDIDSVI